MTREVVPAVAGQTCIGVGDYEATVVARATPTQGARAVCELPITQGNFTRVVDSTSSASVSMPLTEDCCEVVTKIVAASPKFVNGPLRCELEIFRDGELVWCGPIRNIAEDEEQGVITVDADDLSYWFNLRVFRHTMLPGHHSINKPIGSPDEPIDLADIFRGYCEYAIGRGMPDFGRFQDGDPPLYTDDIGLALDVTPTGVTGVRTVFHHDFKIVMSELEELGQTGIDWSVINRRMLVGGGEVAGPDGQALILPGRFTDDDFAAPMRIRQTGEGMATEVLTRGNGVRSRIGGPDPRDGIEITRVLDEFSIEDQVSADAAAQSYYDRGLDPLMYLEGDGGLDPSAPIQMQQLIPGSRVRVQMAGAGCMPLTGGMRLDNLSVTWDADGDKVTPTLQPLGSAGADARGQGG